MVSYRWRSHPAGALRVLAPFLPVRKSHHEVMRAGFTGLRDHLA